MRRSHILFSVVHLFSSLLAIGTGLFCLALRHIDRLQMLVRGHSLLTLRIGIVFLVLGAALFFSLFLINRRRYYRVKMQAGKISIDEKLLRSFLSQYWKENFPEQPSDPDVVISAKSRLEILAELPHTKSEEEKEELLSRLEADLGGKLAKNFGYREEFFLTISS